MIVTVSANRLEKMVGDEKGVQRLKIEVAKYRRVMESDGGIDVEQTYFLHHNSIPFVDSLPIEKQVSVIFDASTGSFY